MLETEAQVPDPRMGSGSAFVGRNRELQELIRGLEDAAAGRGRLFLIGGEPGVGKSRLADELATLARQRGSRTVWGRAWEDAGAPAYWPWIQAFRAYLRAVDSDAVLRRLGVRAADLAQMLPEIAAIVPDLEDPVVTDPDSARFRLFDSAAAFLISAARETPLVVLLDDLHAADAASLLLLRFLTGQLADTRILVVATYRSLELTPDHPLTAALAELKREPATRVLALAGLSEAATGQLIEALAENRPSSGVVSAIWRGTSGNPLFLGEAIRLLGPAGRLERVSDLDSLQLSVPAAILKVITRRLALLGDAAARTLEIGAAFGPEFSVEPVRRVSDLEVSEVDEALNAAMQAGFLAGVGQAGDRFRFTHALVREALHGSLDSRARRDLHRRLGEVLEEQYGAAIDQHVAELAYHFFEAGPDGEDGKAVEYGRRAGLQATAALAYEEAARLLRMALQALGGEQAPVGSDQAELLLLLGDAEARAGDLVAARANFLRAASIAQETNDGIRLARAALGYGGRFIWSRMGDDPHLVRLLQDAIAMVAGSNDRLTVRLQARLACAWRGSPEHFTDSDALTSQALELARRLGDPETLSYALVGRFWAKMWPNNPAERLGIGRELLSVAEGTADPERTIDGHQALYVVYIELGMIPEAEAQVAVVERLTIDRREPPQMWAMRAYETVLALMRGDFDRAAELVDAEELSPSINTIRDDVSTTRIHRFLLRREQGRLAGEEESARASVEEFPWYPFWRAAYVCLLLDLERREEARVVFDELARADFRLLYRDCEWLFAMSMASESCARLGDVSAAEVLYPQLTPYAGRHSVGHSEGSAGAVDRYLGLLASTTGELDNAERHFEDAIRISQGMGALPWVAHARLDLAQVLLRRGAPGDAERADELLQHARETAQRLGMAALLRRFSPEVEAVPLLVPAPTGSVRKGIFRREGEYWTVGLDGPSARVRDAKGMRYLALLLARPGAEVHALDLVAADRGTAGTTPDRKGSTEGLTRTDIGDAGEMLDAEARAAYRERVRELESDLAEAEDWNDPERVARLRSEREYLVRELAAAVGLGGRSRLAASAAERARLNVGKAIRSSIQRIDAHNAAVGGHLGVSVHTGIFCSYVPDPGLAISWEL